jgi:indolepyruvate decarboxylase
MPPTMDTIGRYLLQRLAEAGVGHVFGVPGDYILRFYDEIAHGPLAHVGTTREDTAAFAADGYARCRGLSALAVTYGVGALNVVNAVAGAYAESSPVVVVSGAPGVKEQRHDPLLHHRFGPFDFQREIFQRITCAQAVLDDPYTALREIDRTLDAARHESRPVYIELPRDMVDARGHPVPYAPWEPAQSDEGALSEAVAETVEQLVRARAPLILAGQELHRRGLQAELAALVSRLQAPVAATLTGKSVFPERHAAYLGVYEGAMCAPAVRERVEQADLLLMLGATLNDVDLGIYTARLDPGRTVRASAQEVFIRHHRYAPVTLRDFVTALARAARPHAAGLPLPASASEREPFPQPGRPLGVARLIERLNAALTPDTAVIADTGDCLFGALELRVHDNAEFFASAFYTSMGFAVPAALGVKIAVPQRRALVLVGDGAFQMTGTELSTHARLGLDTGVIVFNNRGYATERLILDGAFNDVAPWRFENLGALIAPLAGYAAASEEEFEAALRAVLPRRDGPWIINALLPPDDASPAMRRLTEHLRARVAGSTASRGG